MAIRLRTVNGIRVALCAAETDPLPGDVYLDDGDHYALAAKFCRDWQGVHDIIDWQYPEEWAAMDTQKLRDAQETLDQWLSEHSFPKAVNDHLVPGSWKLYKVPTGYSVLFCCPHGHIGSLDNHEISAEGIVSSSVACPEGGCAFHENSVRLLDWHPL